jgi:hypothetical protein
MNKEELRRSLDRLRGELQRADFRDAADRRQLELLVAELEHQTGTSGGGTPALVDKLAENVRRFEVEHPTLTASLSQLMSALSSMGV